MENDTIDKQETKLKKSEKSKKPFSDETAEVKEPIGEKIVSSQSETEQINVSNETMVPKSLCENVVKVPIQEQLNLTENNRGVFSETNFQEPDKSKRLLAGDVTDNVKLFPVPNSAEKTENPSAIVEEVQHESGLACPSTENSSDKLMKKQDNLEPSEPAQGAEIASVPVSSFS